MAQKGKASRRLNSRSFATALGQGRDPALGGTGFVGEWADRAVGGQTDRSLLLGLTAHNERSAGEPVRALARVRGR